MDDIVVGSMVILFTVGCVLGCTGSFLAKALSGELERPWLESFEWLSLIAMLGMLAWYGVPFGWQVINGQFG